MSEFIQRAVELPWSFILNTLLIRFVGVFVVLAILMVGMQILGAVVPRFISRQDAKQKGKGEERKPTIASSEISEEETEGEELPAAIGAAVALALEAELKPAEPAMQAGAAAGAWAMAGRVALMNQRLPAGSQRHS